MPHSLKINNIKAEILEDSQIPSQDQKLIIIIDYQTNNTKIALMINHRN
jgi:hypothetical protein